MRKLWLHIGSHKTGTSSLQRNLRRAKNQGQLGHFSYLHLRGHFQANPIVLFEGKGPDMTATLDHELIAKLISKDERDAILSTEMLFWLYDKSIVDALAAQLAEAFDEVRVVAYLRRQDLLALSHRKQVILGRAALDFYGCQIAAMPAHAPHFARYFDYDRKMKLWESAFGASQITVRKFEPSALIGGDTVDDFFSLIGVELSERVASVNQALSREQILIGLWLQKNGYTRAEIEAELARIESTDRVYPSRYEAEAFLSRYVDSNRALALRYDPSNDMFFDMAMSRYPEHGNDQIEDIAIDLDAIEARLGANKGG